MPQPGFTPDPSWPPAPDGWPLLVANRPVDRPRFWGWPQSIPTAPQVAAAAQDRKPTGWEIVLVLLIFPGIAAVSALDTLIQRLTHAQADGGYVGVVLPQHMGASALLASPPVLLDLVPAALVAYLLYLSGGGLTCLGLNLGSPRADLARTGKLLLLAWLVPFLLAAAVLNSAHVDTRPFGADPPAAVFLIPLILSAVTAGVVEEIVVLGYLVHRLEQRGWTSRQVLLTATAVRVSYHLYYGATVLGFIGWGALSVILYRRRRRLLPFIVLHALWDTQGFIDRYLPADLALIPLATLIVITLALFVAGRKAARG